VFEVFKMNFSAADYRAHVGALYEALQVAGAERVAAIEEGSIHMSFHFQGCGPEWWDVGARSSSAYAVITENQPEELLAGRPQTTLRRSNMIQINGWIVYFFPDGNHIYVGQNGVLPECYKNAVTQWLARIRNPDGEGEGAVVNGPSR
jgi:hypothetical protein